MEEELKLQQIVVQEETAPYKRSLAQYGSDFLPQQQNEIKYDELTDEQRQCYDNFIDMIKSLTVL